MGFRFWRRMKIAPGLTLNLSKSGPSLSVGRRGAKFTVGPRGTRATVGIPGTGLFYTVAGSTGRSSSRRVSTPQNAIPPPTSLDMGFLQRMVTPPEEQDFVAGCRELAARNKDAALSHLANALHLADSAFMAGILALSKQSFREAETYLKAAIQNGQSLGTLFAKYGVSSSVELAITHDVIAHLVPCVKSATLALVEIYQREQRLQEASTALQTLYRLDGSDPVVRLSIAEIFMETRTNDANACQKVVQLCEGIENDSEVHAALLLYKAKALRGLKMQSAALDVLSQTLRRTKDRSDELLRSLRYERALVYEDLGQPARARADLEKIYAEAPDYEDVAHRLGLR